MNCISAISPTAFLLFRPVGRLSDSGCAISRVFCEKACPERAEGWGFLLPGFRLFCPPPSPDTLPIFISSQFAARLQKDTEMRGLHGNAWTTGNAWTARKYVDYPEMRELPWKSGASAPREPPDRMWALAPVPQLPPTKMAQAQGLRHLFLPSSIRISNRRG